MNSHRTGLLTLLVLFLLIASYLTLGQAGRLPDVSQAKVFKRVDLGKGPKYVPGEVLVRFRPGTSRRSMLSAHGRVGAVVKREFRSVSGLQLVKLAPEVSVKRTIRSYRKDPNVLYAEPNYIVHTFAEPNDPLFPQQWGLSNTGQQGGTPGADIHAQQAWDVTTGSSDVVVGIIDTGIDYNHPDLAANIWSAPTSFTQTLSQYTINCPAGTHGFTATPGGPDDCNPMDLDGHGTHVAGIIGAVGNNGLGVSGVNWNVQLLACKFTSGIDTVGNAVHCLDFVKMWKDQGVNIIATNNSWGGGEWSQALIDAITAQQQDGILFIAAAGNSLQDNDQVPTYPASLFIPNIISVAATDRNDNLPTFSNFGRYSVHLGAPGVDILSTLPGGVYGLDTGTSMSAPFVTGVAALLKAANPSWDWRTIRNQILAGGDTIPALANTLTGKRLNAYGALTCSNSTVASRLQSVTVNTAGAVGAPSTLAYLNINCGQPNGPVTVQSSSGDTITLQDNGTGADQAAGDGIYTGQWTPQALGSYTLSFPGGDNVNLQVLANYYPWPVPESDYSYRNISGTNLNLGDDSVAAITSPFPIQFGGGNFSNLNVSSNGTISFTDVFGQFNNFYLPLAATYGIMPAAPYPPVTTLVAPFWQDLYPVQGSDKNVFWDVTGTAPNRELVVEWRNVESYECQGDASATVKFQVVFSEGSSDVLFNYANTKFGGNCTDQDHGAQATVGIQVAPTVATTWGFEEAVVGDASGILWKTITATQASNPIPVISSVSPSTAQAGGPDLLVTITGSNFIPQTMTMANAPYCPATYVSSTEMQALVPAADVQYNGSIGIAVFNPPPGGGVSNTVNLTITGEPPPVIAAINPSSVAAGGFGFQLEVDGSGFTPYTSSVQWNGTALGATYVGPNKLTTWVSSALIASPGTAQITVNNSSQGGVSNPVTFTITAAASQSSTPAGSTASPGPNSNPLGYPVPGTIKSAKFLPRFMGWNLARKEGPEYVQHFLRTHAGMASGAASQKQGNTSASRHPVSPGQTLAPQALPGFQFRPSLPADVLPTSVATGDFNHDGHMDWVVANGSANTLWVYFGKGDGTAQNPVIIPLKGFSPDFVAAADLRGSGNLDLIVAEADSMQIGVLLGNGDGTFGVQTDYYIPGYATCLLIDDFNGDGHKDILVGMQGDYTIGEIALLPGDGAGHFGAPVYRPYEHPYGSDAVFSIPYNIAEADLNGDGFPDVVVADATEFIDGSVIFDAYVSMNQQDGTFKAAQIVDERVMQVITSVALGDVNGDGCADLVDTDTYGIATVFPGNCDGTFQTQSGFRKFGVGDIPGALALADVNGDGNLDIITSSVVMASTAAYGVQPGNLVSVLLGDGKGNFGSARVFRGQPSMYSLALADLNGDGKLDVITANQDADSVSVFLNDGTGGFGEPEGAYMGWLPPGGTDESGALNVLNSTTGLKVADINGDGKPDLALLEWGRLNLDALYLTVLLNQGSGQFSAPIRSPVLDGTSITGQLGDFAFADFRGTGRPDFVAIGSQSSASGSFIAFAKNNGDGTFTPLPAAQPAGAQGVLGVGDFNGDGKLDLVVVACTTGSYTNSSKSTFNVFLGNGDGAFTPGYSTTFADLPGAFCPANVWVGDFNGDGKPDVLVQVTSSLEGVQGHDVYEFLGKGDGTFAPAKDVLQNMGAINVADLNHDGIDDIVEIVEPLTTLADGIPLEYAVYLGQRDGSFVLQNTYQLNAGVLAYQYTYNPGVMLGDFNGDGNIDIAAFQAIAGNSNIASGVDTIVQILAGNGDGTFTPTFTTSDFNQFFVPQLTADLNGDGKSDLLELDGYGSAYQVVPADTGPALQLNLLTYPIFGSTGSVRITLAVPSGADTTIQLAASDPAISLPASVVVPANTASQDFQFQIGSGFNPNHVFSIQASLGAQTATTYGWKSSNTRGTFVMYVTTGYAWPIVPGQTTEAITFSVSSLFDYSTDVQFSCTGLPTWANCQFAQTPLYLPSGESRTSSWIVTTTSAATGGSYPFTVVGADGTVTEKLSAQLNIGDFGISITPSTATAPPTGSASYSLSTSSINGYAGSVQTSISGLPAGATVTCCLGSLAVGASNSSLNIQTTNVATGSYTFWVTAAAGSLTHSASATLVVQAAPPPTFTGSITPTAATVSVGQSTNFSITLNSQNGATGSLSFQCLNVPSGTTCTFNPTTVSLPANGSASDTLTVQVNSRPAVVPPVTSIPWTPTGGWLGTLPFLAGLLLATFVIVAATGGRKRRLAPLVVLLLTVAALLLATLSCGGGGSTGSGPPPPAPVTFTITVQASGAGVSTPQNIGPLTITVN